ncbi:cation:proton antiporter [bacterium]|nr:cation:proton antiporter [bacterium]
MSAIILSVGLIIFLAYFFVGLFERTRIPDVLMLTIIGIILGPILGLIHPSDFGRIGNVMTTIALIVILFEGGINLNIKQIKESLDETAYVALSSFIGTMIIISFASWGLFGLEPLVAIMLGAMLGGTSSAVVIPIIKKLKLSDLAYMVLFLESALTDVMCIVVAMSIMSAYSTGSVATGKILGQIISSLILASAIGVAGGYVWAAMIKRIKGIPNTAITNLAYIFILYGLAEFLGFSGAISALAFGITLANLKNVPIEKLKKFTRFSIISAKQISSYKRSFFQEIVFLLKIFFFIYLGLSIKFGKIEIILGGLLITILLFLGRALVVRFFMPKRIPRCDAQVMSVLIPKGLAAAVLASIPLQLKIPGGQIVQDMSYIIVLYSIVFSAGLITLMERKNKTVVKFYNNLFAMFPENDE